jgi:hypothetical protein
MFSQVHNEVRDARFELCGKEKRYGEYMKTAESGHRNPQHVTRNAQHVLPKSAIRNPHSEIERPRTRNLTFLLTLPEYMI